jgi:hypothetical protein
MIAANAPGMGEFKADRSADVVHHDVESLEFQRVGRGEQPTAEPGPGVVGVGGPLRQTEAGLQVDRDAA